MPQSFTKRPYKANKYNSSRVLFPMSLTSCILHFYTPRQHIILPGFKKCRSHLSKFHTRQIIVTPQSFISYASYAVYPSVLYSSPANNPSRVHKITRRFKIFGLCCSHSSNFPIRQIHVTAPNILFLLSLTPFIRFILLTSLPRYNPSMV